MHRALSPWSTLVGQPRVVLGSSPLTLAICRINFTEKLKATTDEVAGAFQDRIDSRYPILDTVTSLTMEFAGTFGHPASSRTLPSQKTLQFSDPSKNWVVSLSNDSISLECRAYESFDDLIGRLHDVLIACIDTVRPTLVNRIGLRYINEIRLSTQAEVFSLIEPTLLGPLTIAPFAESSTSAIQTMELKAGEWAKINLNHGLFSSGTSVQPRLNEVPTQGPFYLLDLDVYQVFEGNHSIAMNADNIASRTQEFHDTLSRIFWWSVTEEFVLQSKGS